VGNIKHSFFRLCTQPKNKSLTPAAKGTKCSRNVSVGTIYLPQCLLFVSARKIKDIIIITTQMGRGKLQWGILCQSQGG
jgi:hypothetical protein